MEQSSNYTLGAKLREMRLSKKWTLNELSQRSGLSISHISSLERGTRTKPSMEVVRKLANALQIPVHYLHDDDTIDKDMYSEADRILSRFSPDTQAFLLQEDSVPYIMFAKRLYELRGEERGIIKALHEFLESTK
ncbi:transcriptional regulator with XRE-family HTH domain [Tumebacillus sp. BK434]|uniref:helix-turn-helix domain-containing protein n=1 Tax=Tumebacillus sp. BK434 TaxID=2512169 RepID=UPI00104EEF5E|nr:helix-turn-helix domain-containing protein [Tumebacillus sp. BK434]TCP56057.1 transcriptional regulator with XRE-family HTH domain [Tumebacillus sp. BK434]